MPHQSESAELRLLQQKAYGRDGGLTDAEARRLQELAQQAAPPSAVAAPEDVPEESRDPTPASVEASVPDDMTSADEPEPEPEPEPAVRSTAGGALRRHWRFAVLASVLLLAIGVGAGWALFGQQGDAIALTAEQQQRRVELYEKLDFDEGTLSAIGQDEEGALVWYGTKQDGEMACLVIDVGEDSGRQCVPRDDAGSFGLAANVSLPMAADAESSVTVNAYLLYSPSGEPLVAIQRWEQQPNEWLAQFGEDRPRAEELVSEQAAMNLTIIGSFRDEPVWLIDRSVDNTMDTCLVIDAVDDQPQCVAMERAVADGITSLVFVDDGAGGSEAWTIQVAYTVSQTPYLVITRDPSPGSVTLSEDSENRDDEG